MVSPQCKHRLPLSRVSDAAGTLPGLSARAGRIAGPARCGARPRPRGAVALAIPRRSGDVRWDEVVGVELISQRRLTVDHLRDGMSPFGVSHPRTASA